MDSIEQLLLILNTHTPEDRVVRVTLSPWAWLLLSAGDIEHQYIAGGSPEGKPKPLQGGYGLILTVDRLQREAYRLWDGEGIEVRPDPM